jgi:uncharacterized protein YndB with AHSA1/START domain
MNINQNAPVVQANEIFINAAPERVWAVLSDINQWPAWNPKITRAALESPVATGAKFNWKVNGASIHSTLHTVEALSAFGWSGVTFGGSAIHNWYLEPQNGGTRVKVAESMEGWLVGLFKNKMNRDLAADMWFWLEKLKAESEL